MKDEICGIRCIYSEYVVVELVALQEPHDCDLTMGRSVTVGGTPQQEQPHHHRQHRSSRSGRSSRRSPPTAPLSYRQYAAATASTTATQPHDGHRHHHYHGDGDGPLAATPPYHSLYEAIERQAEEAADVNSSTAGDSGSYGQGSPAGASSATVKLLTELRHRATELESKLATSAREKERLE